MSFITPMRTGCPPAGRRARAATGAAAAAARIVLRRIIFGFLPRPVASGRLDLAPDLPRHLDAEGELGPLLLHRQQVAFFGAGEAALRADGELLQGRVARRLLDAALQFVLGLQLPVLLVTRPSTTVLPLGRKRSGAKVPARS